MPSKVIFVYSGKGGVGKSTIAVNLAYAVAKRGCKTGLFDADLYGPSLPLMVGKLQEVPPRMVGHAVQPGKYGGVWVGSLGFIGDGHGGHFWIGDYLVGILHQLLFDVEWGVDVLLVDLPPGAGEVHHRVAERIKGQALLVTTPQSVSFADTIKGIDMLRRLQVGVIGVVENMSGTTCSRCGFEQEVFVGDTLGALCDPYGYPLLASLPLDPSVSRQNNDGVPYVVKYPDSPLSIDFDRLAADVLVRSEAAVRAWPTT